jgi:ABC-2 type transport system permease protein
MNVRGGWALMKGSWASWLQYRSFFFVLAFGWMIPPLVSYFIWAAAAGNGSIAGFNHGEFAAYYLILVLVNQLTYSQTNWTVGDTIRMGGLNSWLLRPLPSIYNVLSAEAAGKLVYMIFVVPVAALLALILHPELHAGAAQAGLFLISLLMAWGLRFLWGYALALLAFWTTRAEALLAVQDSLVFLLSGVIAPVALLPAGLQEAARLLPFRYMVGFPVEILVQNLPAGEILSGFLVQGAWLLVSILLAGVLWKNGLRRYNAVGG